MSRVVAVAVSERTESLFRVLAERYGSEERAMECSVLELYMYHYRVGNVAAPSMFRGKRAPGEHGWTSPLVHVPKTAEQEGREANHLP